MNDNDRTAMEAQRDELERTAAQTQIDLDWINGQLNGNVAPNPDAIVAKITVYEDASYAAEVYCPAARAISVLVEAMRDLVEPEVEQALRTETTREGYEND